MTAIHQQIALISTRTNSFVGAWDVETGTHIASFKDNASGPNALALLGHDYLIAAQAVKGALHFWTWHKDAVLQRCYAVEPIVAVACSPDGVYCAGGGHSGSIYLWEVPSGRLLRSWPAHYKIVTEWMVKMRLEDSAEQAVTVLRFSSMGSILLSGGEDTVALAWLLMDLLDASVPQNSSQAAKPLHTWSQHTLPITSIFCGRTMDPVVVTTSLDQQCNINSMAEGLLLRTIVFPAALHSAVMDPSEQFLHVGSADGRIFQVSLVGRAAVESEALATAAAADISMQAHDREWTPLHGHTHAVTSLAYTVDGMFMLSGSEDGTARVWEVRSSQCMRVISAPDKAPVTGLIILDRPPHLASGQGRQGRVSSSDSGLLSIAPKRPQPLAPFCKFMGMQGALQPWEGPPVRLDGSTSYRGQVSRTGLLNGTALMNLADANAYPVGMLKATHDCSMSDNSSTAAANKNGSENHRQGVSASTAEALPASTAEATLKSENQWLKQQLQESQEAAAQWQTLHSELHKFCVDKVITTARTLH